MSAHAAAGTTPVRRQMSHLLDRSVTFALSAAATFVLAFSASFYESLPSTHLAVALAMLLVACVLVRPRLLLRREFALYGAFFVYMLIQLAWTPNRQLALNTLFPVVNFLMILAIYGTLTAFHDVRAVLSGTLAGVVAGAFYYTVTMGFPFVYPAGFSYNSMALLYLFGLFMALLLAQYRRSFGMLPLLALVFAALVLATTSIKANLGIVIGAAAAAFVYFGNFRQAVARNAVPLIALAALLGYAILSNPGVVERLSNGIDRIALGLEVLQAREDLPGYGGFDKRSAWVVEGLRGWLDNPIFGHGVEALRQRLGITSHTTPVDLLYNSGLVGLALFYALFVSLFARLRAVRVRGATGVCALIFGATVCVLFISLSGTMHYSTFLAAFIGISAALVRDWTPAALPRMRQPASRR